MGILRITIGVESHTRRGSVHGGGGVDRFRIKIWDTSSGTVVYDNLAGVEDDADPVTAIGGGSIIIHK